MQDQDQLASMRDAIADAVRTSSSVRIRGGGSKDFLGESGSAIKTLETASHCGIVNYEPTELVLTARSGTPLVEIEQVLAAQGQMLGFEPPHFGAATIGGAVSSGLSGPRRAAAGACRDFVLGARLLNAKGEHLRFGGEVMKNVAGYDVSRLLAGAFGTLGVITEVSVKVIPRPARTQTVMLELDEASALQVMREWAGRPLPIGATSWFDGQLVVRLEGARAAVESAAKAIGGNTVQESAAQAFWRDLREHQHAFFQQSSCLWRLSLPATTASLTFPGRQWIEWSGAQRWLASAPCSEQEALALRQTIASVGGHASLFRVSNGAHSAGIPRFHPQPAALAALQKRIKQQLDPAGVFCPGRLTSDW
jgi:glycolate oxidase FAD binding subunit